MIQVAITHYTDSGRTEETVWTSMPQVPNVGDAVSLGDPDIPTQWVRHVTWDAVQDNDGEMFWHAEITIGRKL